MKKINVVIAAAGASRRYGTENKLFEPCGRSCVVVEAIRPFLALPELTRVVVAVDAESAGALIEKLEAAGLGGDKRLITARGGATRTETVALGIAECEKDCSLILIHDGARPFVSEELIEAVAAGAERCGAAVPLLPLTDNLIGVARGVEPLDRGGFRLVQTPAGFDAGRVRTAYSACEGEYLDDVSVVLKYAPGDIAIVEGDPRNIKITTKSDLAPSLYGGGYDIHRLEPGDGLKLCGVTLPCPYSFAAHSDGDVPVHALMDAILTALGQKDIGHLYPVDDPRFDGADSLVLLKGVLAAAEAAGYRPENCTLTIIAEKPAISPHVDRMRASLAEALGIAPERVGIAATTNEGVGAIGSSEAIASFATVLLKRRAL